jgi:hypothetical protein
MSGFGLTAASLTMQFATNEQNSAENLSDGREGGDACTTLVSSSKKDMGWPKGEKKLN